VRVVSLHPDVLVATSRIWQTTCTIVRGPGSTAAKAGGGEAERPGRAEDAQVGEEVFVIDSPLLPDELEILPALLEQSRFPPPSGLLVTHADWDHMLGRLAFADAALGCAETSAERMRRVPGEAQRELRAFDEEHYVGRSRPLTLGSVQALVTPGHCEIGAGRLELHSAAGHTADGMAIWIGWAGVLVLGDYLSMVEIPVLGEGGSVESYLETLERLRPLVASAEYIVAGHGPVLGSEQATLVLDEDAAYLSALRDMGARAELPSGRRTRVQRRIHAENVSRSSRS
jgi:glyoxylase-like metal-dependent hydrolase (beta-lactamase superfamily II)